MINVRVRKHDRVNQFGIERKVAVPFPRFIAPTMIRPAVEQNSFAVHGENVHRTSYGSRGALELELHIGD
jgi:hypothetical protein